MRKRAALRRDVYRRLLSLFVDVQTWTPRQAEQGVFEIGASLSLEGSLSSIHRCRREEREDSIALQTKSIIDYANYAHSSFSTIQTLKYIRCDVRGEHQPTPQRKKNEHNQILIEMHQWPPPSKMKLDETEK
jgi:hypothetical protein